jgi:hypothetical protein
MHLPWASAHSDPLFLFRELAHGPKREVYSRLGDLCRFRELVMPMGLRRSGHSEEAAVFEKKMNGFLGGLVAE